MEVEASHRPSAWIVATASLPEASTAGGDANDERRVWGLSAGERLRRSLLRAGVSQIDLLRPDEPIPACEGSCVVLRGDLFYDERVLAGLMQAQDVVLEHALEGGGVQPIAAHCGAAQLADIVANLRAGSGALPTNVTRIGVLDLAPAYDRALRKYQEPFVYPAWTADLRDVENRIFAASYKGITDLVTKWVFPVPSREVVRVLARAGTRPNTVTAVSYVLAVAVTWLFYEGWFATGLALGWLMSFLDTVDGKLARCTLTSTRFGDVFDHALDLIHPPFWWAAWAVGLPGGLSEHGLALWVVLGGYLVGRALEGTFMWAFEIQFFEWRPFDGFFRQVIARRNPNMILLSLGVIVGSPAWGLDAVAVWTVLCVVIAAARNIQGHLAVWRGQTIQSWLDEPAETS